MKSGVYVIVNILREKVYIGSSKNVQERFADHKARLNTNTHMNKKLQYAWNKYGKESFDFKILEYTPLDLVIQKEQYWIDLFNCVKEGYNISPIAGGSWNTGTKGVMKPNSGCFKKGLVPWNKNKKGIMPVPWNKGKKTNSVPWNKGKSNSIEVRQKMGLAVKKAWVDGKFKNRDTSTGLKRAYQEGRRNRIMSDETRRKLCISQQKSWDEGRRKRFKTEETKQKMRISRLKAWQQDKYLKLYSKNNNLMR